MKKYICETCGWIYDPAVGDPDGGIEPGTAFEDIPEDWVCPVCGVTMGGFYRTVYFNRQVFYRATCERA